MFLVQQNGVKKSKLRIGQHIQKKLTLSKINNRVSQAYSKVAPEDDILRKYLDEDEITQFRQAEQIIPHMENREDHFQGGLPEDKE